MTAGILATFATKAGTSDWARASASEAKARGDLPPRARRLTKTNGRKTTLAADQSAVQDGAMVVMQTRKAGAA
jgi:hypothetical protein